MASTVVQQKSLADEQSQLDEILNELLGIGGGIDPLQSMTMTKADRSLSPQSGCITTHSGNARTVVSWQASQAGPNKSVHVTKSTHSPSMHMDSTMETVESSYSSPYMADTWSKLPPNAFSYGNIMETKRTETKTETKRERVASPTSNRDRVGSTPLREGVVSPPVPPVRDQSRAFSPTLFRDRVGSPTFSQRVGSPPPMRSSPTSPSPQRLHSVPYKVDYEDAQRGYYSDSESFSWLGQQQAKLEARRANREPPKRTAQEKRLVAELKNAQNSLMRRRAQSEADEIDHARDRDVFGQPNGPLYGLGRSEDGTFSSPRTHHRTFSESDSYKAEKSYFVSGVERPPFTTHQTKYTFSVSPPKQASTQPDYAQNSYGANVMSSKPPPSPGPIGRSSAPNSPLIPSRGPSSKEAVNRTQQRPKEYQPHGRPLTRQRSDTSFDRDQPLGLRRHQRGRDTLHSDRPPSPPSDTSTCIPPLSQSPSPYSEFTVHHQQSSPVTSVIEETLVRHTVTPKQTGNTPVSCVHTQVVS